MPSIKNYLSLVKFSHTLFAMPFALIGLFLGIAALDKIPNVYYNLVSNNSNKDKLGMFSGTIGFC